MPTFGRTDRHAPPIEAEIVGYQTFADGHTEEHAITVRFRPTLPSGQAFDMAHLSPGEDVTPGDVGMISEYLTASVLEEDRKAWIAFLHSDWAPDTDAIAELQKWLTEQYAARPTTRSSDLSGGPPATPTSGAVSTEPVSTPA